jgi:hypothetical protein
MKKRRRFTLFGFGLGGGLILVFLMFSQKQCSWLPGNMVRSKIVNSQLKSYYSDSCISNAGVSINEIYTSISNSRIDFSQSQTKVKPKSYYLKISEGNISGVLLEEIDSSYILKKMNLKSGKLSCDRNKNEIYILEKPSDFIIYRLLEFEDKIVLGEEANKDAQSESISKSTLISVLKENGRIASTINKTSNITEYEINANYKSKVLQVTIQDNGGNILIYSFTTSLK